VGNAALPQRSLKCVEAWATSAPPGPQPWRRSGRGFCLDGVVRLSARDVRLVAG
jgi:hypothetical protein